MAEKEAWSWEHFGGHAPGTADVLTYALEEAIRSALPLGIAPEIEVRNDPYVPLGTVRILIAVGANPTPPLVYDPALNPGGALAAAIEAGEQAPADHSILPCGCCAVAVAETGSHRLSCDPRWRL